MDTEVKDTRAHSWCFTLNNYTPEELSVMTSTNATYHIIGEELAPGTGTPHLQGYLHFASAKKLSTLRNTNGRAHYEVAKGTAEQNYTYCTKSAYVIHENGTMPEQGKRNDLTVIATEVIEGRPIREIALDHPAEFVRYHRGLQMLETVVHPALKRPNMSVLWLWGATGVGKSRYAFDNYVNPYIKDSTKWWDGYSSLNDVIVLDDFDARMAYRDVLRLLDIYPFRGEIKGGVVSVNCQKIIITCDRTPDKLYAHVSTGEFSQIRRRIHEIRELKHNTEVNTEVEGNTIPQPTSQEPNVNKTF